MTEIQDRAEAFVQGAKAKAITVAHVMPQPTYGAAVEDEQPVAPGGGYLQDMVAALVEKVAALELRVEQLEQRRP